MKLFLMILMILFACKKEPIDEEPIIMQGNETPLDRCQLDKDIGPCDALIPRYYYNKISKNCEKFDYGGCKGNENNFKLENDCVKICKSKM